MYQIKITMTDNFVHSYQTDDLNHVESLKNHLLNKFAFELKDKENNETLVINTDHVIAISISEVKDDD